MGKKRGGKGIEKMEDERGKGERAPQVTTLNSPKGILTLSQTM
jgi:hypothetical protein